jgi:acylphosphatase
MVLTPKKSIHDRNYNRNQMMARIYIVRGTVQGVGYRYFVQQSAQELGINGTVRNLSDGSVEVIAVGHEHHLSQLAGRLHTGPRGAEVRGVEEREGLLKQHKSFEVLL